jgi:long-subunit fatty acid transport protein
MLREDTPELSSQEYWDYRQEGGLTALGLSCAVLINPKLSAGATLNFWKDGLTDNRWKQTYRMEGTGALIGGAIPFTRSLNAVHSYSFDGFNFNLGMLWSVNYKLSLGAVFKSSFKADVEHKIWKLNESTLLPPKFDDRTVKEELKMPMSYGIGLVYRFSDEFYVSADSYRTEWGDYVSVDETGNEICPISSLPMSQSDVDATHQVRLGGEYLLMNRDGYVVPIRAGIFYDPAPTEGSPDDFYGFSLGTGLTKIKWFSLDIAYQYRFGNNVSESVTLRDRGFSMDADEHMVYLSVIWYKF